VERTGTGTPIVFSHSLFFDLTMFDHQAAFFGADHHVIRYDHRSQGRSAPGGSLDIDTLAVDAATLIESLDVGPVHFVGNSLGGSVALRLAARRPELLLSASVLGSSGEAEHRQAEFAPLVEALREQGTAAHIDTLMHIMFGDTFLADPLRNGERSHWRAKLSALPNSIAEAAHAVVFRSAILDELAGFRVPVLAIAGEEDHAYGPREAQNIAKAAGGAMTVVPRAGHSVALEEPAAVNLLLAQHIRASQQRRAA
jgi:3-oxoadipate enol-lactonase